MRPPGGGAMEKLPGPPKRLFALALYLCTKLAHLLDAFENGQSEWLRQRRGSEHGAGEGEAMFVGEGRWAQLLTHK